MSVNAVNAYTQVQTQNPTTNNPTNGQPAPAGKNQSSAQQDTVTISQAGHAAQQTNSTTDQGGSK